MPVHPALIAEGFIGYVETLEGDAPLFPERRLNPATNKSGRRWDVDAVGTLGEGGGGDQRCSQSPQPLLASSGGG